MSEFQIGTLASISLLGLAVGSFLYMWGGRKGKWKRRFVGSLVITGTSVTLAALMKHYTPWLLLTYPIVIVGMSLPYGADKLWDKIIKRSVFALGVVSAGLVYCLVFGGNAWWLFIPHVGIAAWSIYLGIKSVMHAAAEETFICVLLNLGLMTYPFMR